ncbi:MAG: hypothetical protein ACJ789_02730 [Thermomicrobiales bacterium]
MVQRLSSGHRDPSETWSTRLEAIGGALDRYPQRLSCIAVTMTEGTVLVSALAWHGGSRHSGWEPVTFRIEDGDAVRLPSAGKLAKVIDEPAT